MRKLFILILFFSEITFSQVIIKYKSVYTDSLQANIDSLRFLSRARFYKTVNADSAITMKQLIVKSSTDTLGTKAYARSLIGTITTIDTTSISNRINARIPFSDTTSIVAMQWELDLKLWKSDTTNKWAPKGLYIFPSDTVLLSTRINAKLNSSDTSNHWAPKGLYIFPSDTVILSTRLNAKLFSSDTSNHWAPRGSYLFPSDTTNKWSPKGTYIFPSDTVLSRNYTTSLLLYKMNYTDTLSLSNRINAVASIDTNALFYVKLANKINYSDTTSTIANQWRLAAYSPKAGSSSLVTVGTLVNGAIGVGFSAIDTGRTNAISGIDAGTNITVTNNGGKRWKIGTFDTTSLSNRINLKLNISDSAKATAGYAWTPTYSGHSFTGAVDSTIVGTKLFLANQYTPIDTANALRTFGNSKADTSIVVRIDSNTFYVSPFFAKRVKPFYTTIQSAINAATSGYTIKILQGVYVENVTVNKNYLTIEGAGSRNMTTSTAVWDSGGTRITGTFNIGTTVGHAISNITFDGGGANADAFTSSVSMQYNGTTIHDCSFGYIGTNSHLLLLQSGYSWQLSNLKFFFTGSGSHGLAIRASHVIGNNLYFERMNGSDAIIVKSDAGSGDVIGVQLSNMILRGASLYSGCSILVLSNNASYITSDISINNLSAHTISTSQFQIMVQQVAGVCKNINLNGIQIDNTLGSAFEFQGGSNISLSNCISSDAGQNGTSYAYTNSGATNVSLINCMAINANGGRNFSGTFTTLTDSIVSTKGAIISGNTNIVKNQNATTRLSIINTDVTNATSRASMQTVDGTNIGEMVSITGNGVYLGSTSNDDLSIMTNSNQRILVGKAGDINMYNITTMDSSKVNGFAKFSTSNTDTVTIGTGDSVQVSVSGITNGAMVQLTYTSADTVTPTKFLRYKVWTNGTLSIYGDATLKVCYFIGRKS